jgi:RNA polymerase sigma factor for flagellar operon FliA
LNGLETATEQHQQIATRKRVVAERVDSLAMAVDRQAPLDTNLEAAFVRIAEVAVGLAVGFMLEGSGMYSDGSESVRRDGYSSLATRQLQSALREAVERLPERERAVVRAHYFEGRQFNAIADELALTKGRISQLHKQALERLNAELASRGQAAFEA